MASVPNTNTFTLNDVYIAVSSHASPSADLSDCFAKSVDAYFDPLYKGAKNSLYNFRNYNPVGITTTTTTTFFQTTTTTTTTQSTNCLTCNLNLWWELNETSGTIAYDAAGNWNGGYLGDVTKGVTGKMSYGLRLNNIENSAVYNANVPLSNNYSVALWINNVTADFTEPTLRYLWGFNDAYNGEGLAGTWAGVPYSTTSFKIWIRRQNIQPASTNVIVNGSTWSHIVLTRSTSFYKLYVNGTLQYTLNYTTSTISPFKGFYLGANNGTFDKMQATYDQVAFWSKVLSQTEITNLYNSGNGLPYVNW